MVLYILEFSGCLRNGIELAKLQKRRNDWRRAPNKAGLRDFERIEFEHRLAGCLGMDRLEKIDMDLQDGSES